jgi:hypothetical protein
MNDSEIRAEIIRVANKRPSAAAAAVPPIDPIEVEIRAAREHRERQREDSHAIEAMIDQRVRAAVAAAEDRLRANLDRTHTATIDAVEKAIVGTSNKISRFLKRELGELRAGLTKLEDLWRTLPKPPEDASAPVIPLRDRRSNN